nr:hypothetical protein [Clostridioides difficile]
MNVLAVQVKDLSLRPSPVIALKFSANPFLSTSSQYLLAISIASSFSSHSSKASTNNSVVGAQIGPLQ